jgi:hypothetical protein
VRTAGAGRAAAVLTWVYAAGFGIPAIPVSGYLLSHGSLPWFLDLFPMLWQGRKVGALVNLALLPVEAIFWLGFALPFPWLVGAARAVLIAIAWRSLTTGQNPQESGIDLDRQPT